MPKESEDWLSSPECQVRLVLLAAERLKILTKSRPNREMILHDLELIEKRVGTAICTIELTPYWIPKDGILPD